MLALLAVANGTEAILDVALTLALLAAFASVALARALGEIRKDGGETGR